MKKILFIALFSFMALFANEIKLIDQNSTDPIYLLKLKDYPKWLCEAKLKNGKIIQFSSVKSMMQLFFHQEYFKRHKIIDDNVEELYIQDYINGNRIKANSAFYLFGSRIIGPHGDDLIPFETKENAQLFMLKNGGTKILPYKKLTKGLIRYLDM